jgi:hypothetical protein
VYDRFNYEIYGLSAGALLEDPPGFFSEEASMLRFNVSTNDLMSIGTYYLVLKGSLNPYLTLQHRFTLVLEEYLYPNTEPPKFTKVFKDLFKVSLQSDKSYKLPNARDADND